MGSSLAYVGVYLIVIALTAKDGFYRESKASKQKCYCLAEMFSKNCCFHYDCVLHSESEMFISKNKDKCTFLEQIGRLLRVKNH